MASSEYAQSDTPLFNMSGPDHIHLEPGMRFENEDFPYEDRNEMNRQLETQIQNASNGLSDLGVKPSYDYRDIETYFRLTGNEPWDLDQTTIPAGTK